MAEGSEQNKTEPASPFKLREAKNKGQVAKSLEINSLVLLGAMLLMSYFMGEHVVSELLVLSRQLFAVSGQLELVPGTTLSLFRDSLFALLTIFWPLVMTLMLVGILANFVQTGPIFTFFPIKPDLKRINPVNGFKRVFSKKLIFESIKTVLKIGILGAIVYFAILAFMPMMMSLTDTDPKAYPIVIIDETRALAYKLILALLLIGLLDLVYTRWDFAKQMRMSQRDVKEEVKRREGDPLIRSKRRQLQKEAVQRAGSLRRVPDADVLITNPTHLAVAIKYQRGQMSAPQVIAKGADELAAKMRDLARKHNVSIVENRRLARALFAQSKVDEFVPEALFPETAKILAWIFLQESHSAQKQHRGGVNL